MDQGFDEFFGFTDADARLGEVPQDALGRPRAEARLGLRRRPVHRPRRRLPRRHKGGPVLPVPALTSRRHFNIEAPDDEVALHRGKFAEADPAEAAERDLRGDGHPARPERRPGPGRARRPRAGRRNARRLHQRPRRDVRGGQPGDEQLPRQQPPVPRPEADALGGRHPRAGGRPLAGPRPGRDRLATRSST